MWAEREIAPFIAVIARTGSRLNYHALKDHQALKDHST